ncbi:FHA domain-containing protein [Cellulomonas dongxiuzhuiae]|uniref:FHA domain-containing protein n=1 Tax=Cellulomonas dongxiuzhuiae TaxID=2819979 RepID=A0ABX8GIB4_9CELL|nr:FHA domain-containing protein [Cellulomonas dongxiuzhuiae]MBO3088011.1 FHA domain-containing protein [Cellulomonas dongxiuzhuiae]MBO3094637.1 FHA domain-containing protein [Cellulomonas dongxiuzhuiae]QWC15648.1 FHA domain-containing protein [Cellulomonas dongxiuzhuiae]
MSVTCPAGHTSESTDYCDVCGAPIGSSTGAAAPATPAPTLSTCPHCGSPAAQGALFCENCGYDFTTGATPVAAASSLDLGAATGAVPTVGMAAPPHTAPGAVPDPLEPPPAVATPPGGDGSTSAPAPDPAAPLGPPPPGGDAWVAELWVDPDWYAAQQAEDPMPSVGLPVLIPLRERSVLVGRPSASRNIRPQVDAGADSGVSRRHCQLNTDGHRWWVEDLQSSNGTFVARVGEPLPDDPIPTGQRHELQDGDRLYLGSWTRLVVRKALPGEA